MNVKLLCFKMLALYLIDLLSGPPYPVVCAVALQLIKITSCKNKNEGTITTFFFANP